MKRVAASRIASSLGINRHLFIDPLIHQNAACDSEIGDLPPLTGFLRMSSLPIARVSIDRAHMERADIAEPTVPWVVSPTRPITAPSPMTVLAPAADRTAGGAL